MSDKLDDSSLPRELFIEELEQVYGGGSECDLSPPSPNAGLTTLAIGEEGGDGPPDVTTMAIGEEDGNGFPCIPTMAMKEEDGGNLY
jgi:hypothetical protein